MWRRKACGMIITPVDVDMYGSFCKECRNEQCSNFVVDVCIVCDWILVRCGILQRYVEEEALRKKHAPSAVFKMTLCGHEATFQEFQKMKQLDRRYINCKRCLQALQLRDLIKDGEI